MAHARHENGGELPEVPAYDYLNRRVKPFPWGPNSLFWNAKVSCFASCDDRYQTCYVQVNKDMSDA